MINPYWQDAATRVLANMPDDYQTPNQHAINRDKVEEIADGIQLFIAELIAGLINAGSERDAVMENETLHISILTELKEWT